MSARDAALIALIVHELRTPLGVTTGSLRQLEGLTDPVQQAAVARALRAAARLDALATQMRDWTRLQSEPPRTAVVALRALLAAAVTPAVAFAPLDIPDVGVNALPTLSDALAALLAAVARAADPGDAIGVYALVDGPFVQIVAQAPGAEDPTGAASFDAEWLGGLGFAMPLARAIVEGSGGQVASAHAADGRLGAISVRLQVAGLQASLDG